MVLEMPASNRRLAMLLLSALLVALATPADAQRRVEVYRARHRTAGELQPLAATALGERGSAAVDPGTNSLVIAGDAAAVADALAVLALQDRALRTVLLHYGSRGDTQLQRAGVRIAWSVAGRSLRIGNVIFPDGRSGALVAAGAGQAGASRDLGGMLRILEGQTGRISTGETRPIHTRQRDGWGSTEYVRAETGFEARPRILSDGRIEVALRPFEERFQPGSSIEQLSAETVVVVVPGETLAVGGIGRVSVAHREQPVKREEERAAGDQLLFLRAEIENR